MKYKGAEIFQRKAEEIIQVLSEPQVDLWKLRELALSDGGLVNGVFVAVFVFVVVFVVVFELYVN